MNSQICFQKHFFKFGHIEQTSMMNAVICEVYHANHVRYPLLPSLCSQTPKREELVGATYSPELE